MRIFYDTEFIDDGRTIDLISIGMVTDDSREYYAVSNEFDLRALGQSEWLMANVFPSLPKPFGEARTHGRWPRLDKTDRDVKPRDQIAREVRDFITAEDDPQLWAWYGAYDHVALAQLFGPMAKLPRRIPMWTNDLRQECVRLGNPRVPKQEGGQHNALHDARHNRAIARFLDEFAAGD